MWSMERGSDGKQEYDIFSQEDISLEVAEENQSKKSGHTPSPKKHRSKLGRIILIILPAILVVAGIAGLVSRRQEPSEPTPITINTQTLDNGTLNELTSSVDGETKQQLTISPDTLFKSNVSIQGSGNIEGDLAINGGLTVEGQTTLRGSVAIDNTLSVGNNLTVSGSITAASLSVGTIALSSIEVSSDVTFGGHLIPNGSAPSAEISVAATNGNVRVTGNDTAGTVLITIGSTTPAAGEMAIITFSTRFAGTPKVQLTPVNSAAAGLRYYATRNAGFFTIDTTTAPTAGTTYAFDYLVTQ